MYTYISRNIYSSLVTLYFAILKVMGSKLAKDKLRTFFI